MIEDVREVYRGGLIPLGKAWLCVTCEYISESSEVCPKCGDSSLLNLQAILNREG